MFLADLALPLDRSSGVSPKGLPFIPMAALPPTLTGMPLAMGNSLATVVAAEMIAATSTWGADPQLAPRGGHRKGVGKGGSGTQVSPYGLSAEA